ncbi:DUF4150 domain-containing protein [Methylobacterium terrae]|uniref:DUF4150 domain-containing protein n=1 Tax=Methylobacterium terrae TaxID=2202827 RepID=UPI0013A54C54|nr:DUF4150 domain-containing protein [Methylobacterium terrae]
MNDLTLCHKHSAIGFVRATLPDVCRSPVAPVPYSNVAYARDLENGTVSVRSHGGAMNGVKGSRFYPSYDDEPGTGGGVTSGVNRHEATWLSWSPNVFMEGRPVTRLTDKMLMNRGNTVSVGGYYTGKPRDEKNRVLAEQICKAACECEAAGTMSGKCVADKVESWARKLGRNIMPEVAWEIVDGIWQMRQGPDGRPLRGGGKRPGDFIDMDLGGIHEYKGPRDRLRRGQSENLNSIAADNGLVREDINFKKDCDCSGSGDDKDGTATAPATSLSGKVKQFSNDHPYVATGLGAAAVLGTGGAVLYFGVPVVAGTLGVGALGLSATQ